MIPILKAASRKGRGARGQAGGNAGGEDDSFSPEEAEEMRAALRKTLGADGEDTAGAGDTVQADDTATLEEGDGEDVAERPRPAAILPPLPERPRPPGPPPATPAPEPASDPSASQVSDPAGDDLAADLAPEPEAAPTGAVAAAAERMRVSVGADGEDVDDGLEALDDPDDHKPRRRPRQRLVNPRDPAVRRARAEAARASLGGPAGRSSLSDGEDERRDLSPANGSLLGLLDEGTGLRRRDPASDRIDPREQESAPDGEEAADGLRRVLGVEPEEEGAARSNVPSDPNFAWLAGVSEEDAAARDAAMARGRKRPQATVASGGNALTPDPDFDPDVELSGDGASAPAPKPASGPKSDVASASGRADRKTLDVFAGDDADAELPADGAMAALPDLEDLIDRNVPGKAKVSSRAEGTSRTQSPTHHHPVDHLTAFGSRVADANDDAAAPPHGGAVALDDLRSVLAGETDEEPSSTPEPLAAPRRDHAGSSRLERDLDEPDADPQGLAAAAALARPEPPGALHGWPVGLRLGLMVLLGLLAIGAVTAMAIRGGRAGDVAREHLVQAEAAQSLVPVVRAGVDGASAAVEAGDPDGAVTALDQAGEAAGRLDMAMADAGIETRTGDLNGHLEDAGAALVTLREERARLDGPDGALGRLEDANKAFDDALESLPFAGTLAARGQRVIATARGYMADGQSGWLDEHRLAVGAFRRTLSASALDGEMERTLGRLSEAQAASLAALEDRRAELGDVRLIAGDTLGLLGRDLDRVTSALSTALPELTARAETARMDDLRRLVMVAGGVALAYVLLCWMLARTVTGPLRRLVEATSGLSIDAAPPLLPGVTRKDGFGSLARSMQDFRLTVDEQAEFVGHQAQAAKAYLAAVLEGSPEALVTIDERGTIVGFNPAAEDMFGYAAKTATGRSVAMLMPGGREADQDRGLPWFRPQDADETVNPVRRVQAQRADGGIFSAELTVQEVERAQGGVLFAMFLRDLTDLESRMREVERARGRAEEAQRAHGEFLNVLANELSMPVESMSTALSSRPADGNKVRFGVSVLHAITNDVRAFANLEGGLVDLDFAPVSVRGAAEKARKAMIPLAKDFRLQVSGRLEPGVPDTLLGDEALLHTVLANLLECGIYLNAFDPSMHASQPGAVGLTVRRVEKADGWVRVRFEVGCDQALVVRKGLVERDGQPPISPAAKLRLETSGRRGRTGMVLVITKRLVQLMRGDIGLESWPGRGTVLWVELDA